MFARLQLELQLESDEIISYQKAVLLQSVLMERVDPAYAERLHQSVLHPYRQSVVRRENKNIWTVCTTSGEAYQNILLPLQDSGFSEFVLEHDSRKVSVVDRWLEQIERKRFMEEYYLKDADRYFRILFKTPTAFKRQGEYVSFPDLRLIYQSLMKKYDASAEHETVESEELLEQLVQYSRIVRYDLHSCSYSVHGARVPAFMGQMQIRVAGPHAMVNFVSLLLHFGEYSGIGIKTAMGMGDFALADAKSRKRPPGAAKSEEQEKYPADRSG